MGTYCVANDELRHHGILGMHWGIRRYQPYGTAYDAEHKGKFVGDKNSQNGSNSNSNNSSNKTAAKKKSALKSKIDNQNKNAKQRYKRAGMTDEEAAAALEKRKKIMKVLGITAGVTIAAAGAYLAYRGLRGNVLDVKIPKGIQLQTLSNIDNKMNISDSNMDFYTAFKKGDKNAYTGLFGEETGFFGLKTGNLKKKQLANVAQDMKIASTNKSASEFGKMMKNNTAFKDTIVDRFNGSGGWDIIAENQGVTGVRSIISKINSGQPVSDKEYKKLYKAFNTALIDQTDGSKTAKKMFYENMKKLGYDGIIDFNDKSGKGLKTAAPAIIFNDSKLTGRKTEALTKEAVNKARNLEILRNVGLAGMNSPYTYAALAGLPLAAANHYDDKVVEKARKKKRQANGGAT